jgi:prolyl-tRNA synthetase
MGKKITPRSNDYSKWYNDIISEAGLAESSDVRGCMVIKPYGFAIWELMKSQLDDMFKETGHENAKVHKMDIPFHRQNCYRKMEV